MLFSSLPSKYEPSYIMYSPSPSALPEIKFPMKSEPSFLYILPNPCGRSFFDSVEMYYAELSLVDVISK